MPAFRSISSQRMCTALHGNCATVQGNSRTPPPQTLHSLPCMGPCCCAERLQVLLRVSSCQCCFTTLPGAALV